MSSTARTLEDGPVALVTGAAGGIGGAVTEALAAAGHAVLAVDRDAVSAPRADAIVAHVADLADDDQAAGAVAAALERFGRLDVVVCAHGGSGRRFGDGPVDECTPEGWDATLELNLRTVFLIVRHAVPVLRAGGGGAIVTVSSVLGLVGGDRDFATHAYAASKGAAIALMRAMAVTYAPDGIRCNVVCPGLIATPMSARAQADPAIRARLGELQPLTGDFGRPEDVAAAVVHVAGSAFTTGSVLTVDGGWTAPMIHLGLDLGGTNIKCAVLDGGEVVGTAACPTGAADGPDAVLDRVAALGRATVAPFGEPATAGLALPGHFEAGAGVLLPNLLGDWEGRPIAGPVGQRLGLAVTLVNDVRALTLAELRLGAGRGARHLVCVALGTGVGGGVVIDGRLHLGLGHAGEIGHTTVDPDGPPCGCGNRGCLDRMAGADAIAAAAGRPTVQAAAEAARAGDPAARAAFDRAGEYVGRVLAGAVVLLWPERIVVGGGVADAGELLFDPLRAELRRRACVAPVDRIGVVRAELGPHAGAVGAALWSAEVSASA